MANKRGLGMGLDALIQPKEEISNRKTEETIIKEVDKIDINKIEPNSLQPRKSFNEDSLQELADSIKQHGMIEPLIVQKGKKGFYQIIAGERRWRASKIAGIKEVPVIVKEYSSQEVVEIALIENLQREDLNPIEEAEAYHSLIEEYNLKQDEVAEKVSKSRVAITNALRLLKLDARVREMLIEDKIKSGHARALLSIEDGDLQYETATRIFDEKFSVRETEKLVKKILNGDNKKEEKALEEDEQLKIVYQGYEEKLKSIIGTKVHINRNKDGKKGKIEIEYYSPDEFERIVDLMSHLQ
ncbi:MAG: ParB/RepB/Spo0J family partition protein [Lachnospiraceae bacterium]|jgi:ParB-like partition proteins|nr:ParB/RepB/Spo0J family partition protein [Lachnospiraceae bacterium]MCX4374995.1 ParB/RepB/Spo0J family partition protein [Lachnospiraceae bacterium]RKI30593.1 ParB/RepB/Spo0J family partition protein [bacterium D16-36]RKI72104.1 ParB/RepB/Spo0J family partition protein [bacterium 1xD8-6]